MTNSNSIMGEELLPTSTVQDPASTDVQPVAEAQASYLDVLVGEGKKFANAEALAKAKLDADLHIKRVEEENKALRNRDTNYDLILAELSKKQQQPVANQDLAAAPVVKQIENIDIKTSIKEVLAEERRVAIEENNFKATWESLAQTYGNIDIAKKVIANFIEAKPYMKNVINELGRTNPSAALNEVLAFRNPNDIGSLATNPLGDLPTSNSHPNEEITWSEATKIRKSNPRKYESAEYKMLIAKTEAKYKAQGKDYFKS